MRAKCFQDDYAERPFKTGYWRVSHRRDIEGYSINCRSIPFFSPLYEVIQGRLPYAVFSPDIDSCQLPAPYPSSYCLFIDTQLLSNLFYRKYVFVHSPPLARLHLFYSTVSIGCSRIYKIIGVYED